MSQDWDIKRRHEICCGCESSFTAEQSCRTALTWGNEGYQRFDYCEGCWAGKGAPQDTVSAWQGEYVLPPAPGKKAFTIEDIEQLMRDLAEGDGEPPLDVLYLLSVMLERKRILVERDVQTRDDGVTIRVYEHRKTGESFIVRDPELKLDELDQVRERVMQMLALPEPDPEPEPESRADPEEPKTASKALGKLMRNGGFATDEDEPLRQAQDNPADAVQDA